MIRLIHWTDIGSPPANFQRDSDWYHDIFIHTLFGFILVLEMDYQERLPVF